MPTPGETKEQKQAKLAAIQVPDDIAAIPMGPNNYRRLVYQGEDPEAAREIVLKGSHGGEREASQANVNEARKWNEFRNPNCPKDFPYNPDPNHWKNAGLGKFGGGGPPPNACLEKPQDWDLNTGAQGYMTPGGWQQGSGQVKPDPYNPRKAPPSGRGGPAPEAKPVTHGTQLSYTGDPMQDMLIYQFNSKANLEGTGKNIFGLGEDRAVGGKGKGRDMQDVIGQVLSGGGLWWSGSESAFQGEKGKKKKAAPPPSPQAIAAPPPPATPPPATPPPTQPEPGKKFGVPFEKDPSRGGPMSGMLTHRYGDRRRMML